MYKIFILCFLMPALVFCNQAPEQQTVDAQPEISATIDSITPEPAAPAIVSDTQQTGSIRTGNTDPAKLIAYSKTLKGIPYKYASTNPAVGFDCSGFITYVFNHFDITVPRTSVDFTNEGTPIDLKLSRPGDLILFTGTDSTIRTVGHMGIITYSGDSIVFIHSTSGKAYGVTETTLNPYYMGRFMKVIRVFE
jgi:cell wall-associated NlpC family hydrolase